MNLDLTGFRSLRVPDPDRLRRLGHVDSVVIVGPSCAGKTTLVDAVRASDLVARGLVDVPTRYLTRPPRAGDSTIENTHVSEVMFARHVSEGVIALDWVRVMERGRAVRYGFRAPRPGTLPVYSANNGIYAATTAELRPAGALAHALFVGVYAPREVRAARLRRRSPDLASAFPDEAAHRLADDEASMLPHVHLVIDDHGDLEAIAPIEIVRLARGVAAPAA